MATLTIYYDGRKQVEYDPLLTGIIGRTPNSSGMFLGNPPERDLQWYQVPEKEAIRFSKKIKKMFPDVTIEISKQEKGYGTQK